MTYLKSGPQDLYLHHLESSQCPLSSDGCGVLKKGTSLPHIRLRNGMNLMPLNGLRKRKYLITPPKLTPITARMSSKNPAELRVTLTASSGSTLIWTQSIPARSTFDPLLLFKQALEDIRDYGNSNDPWDLESLRISIVDSPTQPGQTRGAGISRKFSVYRVPTTTNIRLLSE